MSTPSSEFRSRPSHFRFRFQFSRIQHELMEINDIEQPGWVGYVGWVIGGERTLDVAEIFRGVSFPDVHSFRSYLGRWPSALLIFRVITELLDILDISFQKLIDIISRFLGTLESSRRGTRLLFSKGRACMFPISIYTIQVSFCFRVAGTGGCRITVLVSSIPLLNFIYWLYYLQRWVSRMNFLHWGLSNYKTYSAWWLHPHTLSVSFFQKPHLFNIELK